jgi:hypothetical protein
MPNLKTMARQALIDCNAFADAATRSGNGPSEGYRRIAQAYHSLAGLLISELNVEAREASDAATRDGESLHRDR